MERALNSSPCRIGRTTRGTLAVAISIAATLLLYGPALAEPEAQTPPALGSDAPLSEGVEAAVAAGPAIIRHLKGGARVGEPPAWPVLAAPLLPRPVAIRAEIRRAEAPVAEVPPGGCGPALAAAPLYIGEKDRFAQLGGLVKGVALGALGKVLETASGGVVSMGGKQEAKPNLYDDPIAKRSKQKVAFDDLDTRVRIGGKLASDGLLLSTRLDKAPDKGTVHAIYLEDENCQRIFPFAYYAYELWGEWSLTVSWTRTVDTYQDGQLIDRDVSSGGFSDAGRELLASGSGAIDLATGEGTLPPGIELDQLRQYQERLRNELGDPVWLAQGFGAPTSGIRSLGTPFRASPEQMQRLREGGWKAVVHVTRERSGGYESVGLPMQIRVGPDSSLSFEALLAE